MSMQALLSASQSMARMQTLQSARTQMQGTANILRMESKQDGGNAKKLADADALEKKSNGLMGDLMEEVDDVNETLKPDEEVKEEEKQKEQSTENNKKEDKVTLSDIAAGYRGDSPKIHPAMGEAVTYDAEGSKTSSAPAKADPTFEVTA